MRPVGTMIPRLKKNPIEAQVIESWLPRIRFIPIFQLSFFGATPTHPTPPPQEKKIHMHDGIGL